MKKQYDIFELAIIEIRMEGKINDKKILELILDRAFEIRKWFDMQARNGKRYHSRRKRKYETTKV